MEIGDGQRWSNWWSATAFRWIWDNLRNNRWFLTVFEMICIDNSVILACEEMPVTCDPWESLFWEVLSCPANAQPRHILRHFGSSMWWNIWKLNHWILLSSIIKQWYNPCRIPHDPTRGMGTWASGFRWSNGIPSKHPVFWNVATIQHFIRWFSHETSGISQARWTTGG